MNQFLQLIGFLQTYFLTKNDYSYEEIICFS